MSDKPELLPCPFCGSKRILLDWDLYETEEGRRHRSRIRCMDCRLEPKIFKTHAEARSYWNTRAAPPEDVRSVVDEPVGVVDESDDGIFIELIYGENGNPLNRGDLVYRRPQCSEVSPQCSEHLRTQVTLLLPHTPLPHPPRHEGFLQPEREVPGYTIEQMKEYGALCAAEALRHNK